MFAYPAKKCRTFALERTGHRNLKKSFLFCKLLLVHSAKSHGEANGVKRLKLTEVCVVYHQTGQMKPIQHEDKDEKV